jgi:uncharacterized protein YrrD
MILSTEIQGWEVKYDTGERIGKVQDLIVDTEDPGWPLLGLVVSQGLGKRAGLITLPTPRFEVDKDEKALVKQGRVELKAVSSKTSSADFLSLRFLNGAKVYSSDEKLIGKVYDFVIVTSTKKWRVWRFLVNVPGLRSRRLRLPISDIATISRGKIVLHPSKDEIHEVASADLG